jgi:hypothetical protein
MAKDTKIEELNKTDQFIISVALQEYASGISNNTIIDTENTIEETVSKIARIFDHERYRNRQITLTSKEIEE